MKLHEYEYGDRRQSTSRGLLDALLVALCVAMLLVLAAMLRPGPQRDLLPDTKDAEIVEVPDDADAPRRRLMALGFALLLVSLAVCLYTMHRLGFCCARREYNRARLPNVISSSRLPLVADLPPAYDAIVQPPPCFAIAIEHDKHARKACSAAGEVSCAGRPREAG